MLEKQFNPDLLYNKIVHFYIDKKRLTKEQANQIARSVVARETEKRICKNKNCKHFLHNHIRNTETCIVKNCECRNFVK